MTDKPLKNVTRLLQEVRRGEAGALERLLPAVYAELRRIAGRQLRGERQGHTLQPTAVVHEAYVRLVDQADIEWESRAHFYGVAARAMRQVLIDYARRRKAEKRGGGKPVTSLTGHEPAVDAGFDELLSLDDALDKLDQVDERLRTVVEYKYFGGMTEDEIAAVLGVTSRTVQRDWVRARAWLYRELYDGPDDE